jgi:hypothetical protein
MSFIGGYQSNFNFNALQLVGDFPIDHALGGYGVASGTNIYALSLNPAITGYRAGLPLEVKFTHPNTGAATIDVDGNGPKVIKKIVNGVLADVEAGDLAIYKVYILIYDGVYFQVANLNTGSSILLPPDATEDLRGIAQIASSAEINAGIDNSKIVTPAKLAAYVANKLTGLWEDKGLINCSTNPLYPAGQVGDAYTVSAAGKIGGINGTNVNLRAIIYCNGDNPGGAQVDVGVNWTVIQPTTEQATEAIVGMARIALQEEVNVGIDNSTIVSPLKLKTFMDSRFATELISGLAELATQAEVNAGVDDSRIVTPLKLKNFIATSFGPATEETPGTAQIATTKDVNIGTDNKMIVTPAKLAAYVGSKVTGLWKDKGLMDCLDNPNYPSALSGDAYTVNVAGKIGGPLGQSVSARDIIYCNRDTASGDEATAGSNWNIIQANLEQATEAVAGYARIALQTEVNLGESDQAFVTPLKLKGALDVRSASEILSGLAELATQVEVNTGTDDSRIVTPLKLKNFLSTTLSAASEGQAGLAQVASTADVNTGVDNTKFITPAKLSSYVASKITGLWEDKGVLDCSTNPNYPSGQKGDAYTINVAGKIGGAAGQNVGLRDVLYCSADTPAGTEAAVGANWNILQANLDQATETLAGYARVATQAEVNASASNSTFVTPLKLKGLLDGRQASEVLSGLMELASQTEVDSGTDDLRAVTPLKLLTLLNNLLQYKTGTGLNSILPKRGLGNSASANFAAILSGQNNTASGQFALASGQYASATLFNEFARASGGFYNTPGSAQNSVINLYNIIPSGALSYPLTLDGNGLSGTNRWRPPIDSIQSFTAKVMIVQNSGSIGYGTSGDCWVGIFEGALKNSGGAVSWIGGEPTLRGTRQDAGFFPTIQFIPNGNEITIAVDGMINRSLFATVTLYLNQTKFSLG